MKPIFSTEQARYQKFASFFIDVTGISRSAERDQGYAALGDFALCGGRQGLLALDLATFWKRWTKTFHRKVFYFFGGAVPLSFVG